LWVGLALKRSTHSSINYSKTFLHIDETLRNRKTKKKMNKKRDDEKKGNQMRAAALTGMGSEFLKYLNIK
jgi:hypothetical protein